MSAIAIPPKEKAVYRDFTVEPYELMRLTAELTSQYALRAWNWLKSHKPGWKVTVEEMAERFRCSVASVYRGLAELEERKLLVRTDDTFRLTVPADPPILTTANTRGQEDRAHTPTRSAQEVKDKKPTYVSREYSEREKQGVDSKSSPKSTPQGAGTNGEERDPEKLRKPAPLRPPKGAPDHAGRPEVPIPDRLPNIQAFLNAWSSEFSDGPSSLNYMTLPAMWQERVLWMHRHWTADEIRAAYLATVENTPRKGWPYFRACLERIARGEWDKAGGGYVRTESGVARAGSTHAPAPPAEGVQRKVVDIREIAKARGYDPDDLTPDQRAECLAAKMRGAP